MTGILRNPQVHGACFMQGHIAEYPEPVFARRAGDPNAVIEASQAFFKAMGKTAIATINGVLANRKRLCTMAKTDVPTIGTSGLARRIQWAALICLIATLVHPGASSAQGDLPAVSAKRGIALFEAICAKTLPNFSRAENVAKVNKITFHAGTGTFYSTIEDLSFRLADGPGNGKTCSIVFMSKQSKSAFHREAARILTEQKIIKSSIDEGGLYDGKALVLVNGPIRASGKKYFSLKMLSQR